MDIKKVRPNKNYNILLKYNLCQIINYIHILSMRMAISCAARLRKVKFIKMQEQKS